MANYSSLKNALANVIKPNNNQEITGQIMQDALMAMINALGAGYQFAGVPTAQTDPSTPDQNVFYIAGAGTYPNFGGTVVPRGSVGVFRYNGEWDYTVLDVASWADASNKLYYNTQAGNVAAKTIQADGFTLQPGGWLKVHFDNANTVDNPTLNVNNTGAHSMTFNGRSVSATNSWKTGETVAFYYDNYGVGIWHGIRLVELPDFVNVNELVGQSIPFASASAARSAIPQQNRKAGLNITYLLSTGENTSQWVQDMFIGDDVTDWSVADNWKTIGPVSVSQNTLKIGDDNKMLSSMILVDDAMIVNDYPPRADGSHSMSGYFNGYRVSLSGLYEQGVRSILFRGANSGTIGGSGVVPGLVALSDDSIESVELGKTPNTNDWYILPITAESSYLYGSFCHVSMGGEVWTPVNVICLNRTYSDVKADITNLKDIIGCPEQAETIASGEKTPIAEYDNLEVTTPLTSGKKYRLTILNNGNFHLSVRYIVNNQPTIIVDTPSSTTFDWVCPVDDVSGIRVVVKSTDGQHSISLAIAEITNATGLFKADSDIIELISNKISNIRGRNGLRKIADTLPINNVITFPEFPYCNKVGNNFAFTCKFSTFASISICQGYQNYRARWFIIDNTAITLYGYETNDYVIETVNHGLLIEEFITGNIQILDNTQAKLTISTLTGSFEYTFVGWTERANGLFQFRNGNQILSSVCVSATSNKFTCPIWIFGASFEGMTDDRWFGQYVNLGYKNVYCNALAGRDSIGIKEDFNRALNYGCPKYLYMTAFGNDATAAILSDSINYFKGIAKEKGFELILCMRPNSLNTGYADRRLVIENSGCRYVNAVEALSPDGGLTWYDGLLSADGVHPTVIGAKILADRCLCDIPELMQY